MNVAEAIDALQQLAPLEFAASWDNVGLLIGSDAWPCSSIMLTIDLTPEVMAEAIEADADMIVAYHPPIFEKIRRVTDATRTQWTALAAIGAGIAVYSPHTALDAAPGGVNDWLAAGLGPGDVRALDPHAALPATQQCKLVTFCPAASVDALRTGLANAGAGRIGDYEQCSFELRGQGTFHGGAATKPAIGKAGTLERVDEVRLEMVCPQRALADLVAVLGDVHPYEEPPIEIYPLSALPQRGIGEGRVVTLDEPVDLQTLVQRARDTLGVSKLKVAVAHDQPETIRTVGLCAGAGGSMLERAIAQKCDLFITGEMRHHDALAAKDEGCSIILAGHTNTERGYLPVLKQRLADLLGSDVPIVVSQLDREPFDWV